MSRHGCCVDGACDDSTCMALPDGLVCGDCVYFKRCAFVVSVKPENQHCDWFPRRFKAKAGQESRKTLELSEQGQKLLREADSQ